MTTVLKVLTNLKWKVHCPKGDIWVPDIHTAYIYISLYAYIYSLYIYIYVFIHAFIHLFIYTHTGMYI